MPQVSRGVRVGVVGERCILAGRVLFGRIGGACIRARKCIAASIHAWPGIVTSLEVTEVIDGAASRERSERECNRDHEAKAAHQKLPVA